MGTEWPFLLQDQYEKMYVYYLRYVYNQSHLMVCHWNMQNFIGPDNDMATGNQVTTSSDVRK